MSEAARKRPDWVIEMEAVNGPCYVNECLQGDPGHTMDIKQAERYATENEACENMQAIRSNYPARRYAVRPLIREEVS